MRPRVTIVIAMRNEERYIARCLHSLFEQTYPSDLLEILVYDGMSTDQSRERALAASSGRRAFHMWPNPSITQASGWNQGIRDARGEIIGIASAHAEFDASYVQHAVETLERTGADMVGGPVEAKGSSPFGKAVAAATSGRFGTGGAAFRIASREQRVDTVFMGVARRTLWHAFPFDEEMVKNQDDELSYRLLDAGRIIVCNPAIRSSYYNRQTPGGLLRQYTHYGMWKVRVLQKHPRQVRLRHIAPAAFVGALISSVTIGIVHSGARRVFGAAIGAYAAANLIASSVGAIRSPGRHAIYLPYAFALLHFGYGLGFLYGLFRFRSGWRGSGARSSEPAALGASISSRPKASIAK